MELSRRFAVHVKRLRKQQGLSQDDLAARASNADFVVNRALIANVETRSNAAVPLDLAWALARGLEVPLDQLVTAALGSCSQCHGSPPPGFSCRVCGA